MDDKLARSISHIVVTMHWNKATEQWRMLGENGNTIQEFFNCENISRIFPKLDKRKENKYQILLRKLGS